MAKKKNTAWVCQSCGARAYKWTGYCTGCGEWNTIVEEVIPSAGPAVEPQEAFLQSPQRLGKSTY